jgi:hypothetical protein
MKASCSKQYRIDLLAAFANDIVGGIDFLEPSFCIGIIGMQIGMASLG